MNLSKDARIITADGKDIGNLNRFVIDPRTKKVMFIVFESGNVFGKEEYLIPIHQIDRVEDNRIILQPLGTDDVAELTRFNTTEYVITNERALLGETVVQDEMITSYYYYPVEPIGSAGFLRPMENYTHNISNVPGSTQMDEEQAIRRESEQNIPPETVALKEGAKVVSADMKQVGAVEKVLVDPQSERASHLLITKGLLVKEKKLIPVDWVETIGEGEVYLAVKEDFLATLPDYQPK